MTVKQLIEKHAKGADIDDVHWTVVRSVLEPFSVELLENMRKAGSFHSNPGLAGICTVEEIKKALVELKK